MIVTISSMLLMGAPGQAPPYRVFVAGDLASVERFESDRTKADEKTLADRYGFTLVVTREARVLVQDTLFKTNMAPALDTLAAALRSRPAATVFGVEPRDPAAEQTLRSLIRSGPFSKSGANRILRAPGLRIGVAPMIVATLTNGSRKVRVNMDVGQEPGFSDTLRTPGLEFSAGGSSANGTKASASGGAAANSVRDTSQVLFDIDSDLPIRKAGRNGLTKEGLRVLSKLTEEEQAKVKERLDAITRGILDRLAGGKSDWNGKDEKAFSSLTPQLQNVLRKSFLGTSYESLGFGSEAEASAFLSGAKIQGRTSLMLWIAGKDKQGPAVYGFSIDNSGL